MGKAVCDLRTGVHNCRLNTNNQNHQNQNFRTWDENLFKRLHRGNCYRGILGLGVGYKGEILSSHLEFIVHCGDVCFL